MKATKLFFVIASIGAFACAAHSAEFQIDPAHTNIGFKVKHLGISTVSGKFDKFSGTLDFDPKDLKTLKANVTIEAASVNTGVEKRDNHLRNPDFFDTAKFADLKFVSKAVTEVTGNSFKLTGDFTLHGVTKTVTLEGEFGGTSDAFGPLRAGFSATTTINREDFGITAGTAGAVVGKEIKITLDVEAVQKK